MRGMTVIALAAVLGVAYALLTPPFEVPDETYHFWRPLVIALRVAPDFATPLTAVMLLPMTLAQFASWSADALTIALAALLTALLLAERAPHATVAVAFLLALCKPAYFLIALLALHTRYR